MAKISKLEIGLVLGVGGSVVLVVTGIYFQNQYFVNGGAALATILMVIYVAYQAKATKEQVGGTWAMVEQAQEQIGIAIEQARLTRESLEEIRKERMFGLMKGHTKKLKERVIKPWLEELGGMQNAKKRYTPRPSKKSEFRERPYVGEDLQVEKNEPWSFKDLVENHNYIYDEKQKKKLELEEYYQKFKDLAKKLDERTRDLEAKVEEFLEKENRDGDIRIISYEEAKKYGEEIKIGYFEKNRMKEFLLDNLLIGENGEIKFLEGFVKFGKLELPFYLLTTQDEESAAGLYIAREDERIKDNKIILEINEKIQKSIESLLEKAKRQFEEDIKEIHQLVDEFNECKEYLVKALKKLEDREVYDEECDYIKFSLP